MVAVRSNTYVIFALSEAKIVVSNPTQGMDIWYVHVLSLWLGIGLATS
jgi:hypothetical protein